MEKSRDALRTISEVADWLGVPTHVLRFWESRFSQVRPIKRAGARRYYRPTDIALLGGIRKLLYDDGMTIRGVQKILRERGVGSVAALAPVFGEQTGDGEANIPTSASQKPTPASSIESDGSEPTGRETREHMTAPALTGDETEPSVASHVPTTADSSADSGMLAARKQVETDETRQDSETTVYDWTKADEQVSHGIEGGSHPPSDHAEDSVSGTHAAELIDDIPERIDNTPTPDTRPGPENSMQPADTDRSSAEGDASESESHGPLLDIYNRLLALRDRMDQGSSQPDGNRSG